MFTAAQIHLELHFLYRAAHRKTLISILIVAGQRPTFYHCNTQTNQDVIPEQKKPTGADPKIPNLYIHGVTLRAADTKAWPMVKSGVDVDFRTCKIADADADVKDC